MAGDTWRACWGSPLMPASGGKQQESAAAAGSSKHHLRFLAGSSRAAGRQQRNRASGTPARAHLLLACNGRQQQGLSGATAGQQRGSTEAAAGQHRGSSGAQQKQRGSREAAAGSSGAAERQQWVLTRASGTPQGLMCCMRNGAQQRGLTRERNKERNSTPWAWIEGLTRASGTLR